MKEYSKHFIDRLALTCVALAVITAASYIKLISTTAPALPLVLYLAIVFAILGSIRILQTRTSKRNLNLGLIVSGSVFIVTIVATTVHASSPVLIYISAISAVFACIFLVTSASSDSKNVTLSKNYAEITVKISLLVIALFVIIYFGIIKGRLFSDYLWVAIAVGVLAMLARKGILRTTTPKKD